MTDTLGAGIALISIGGREFSQVSAVTETLTGAFAYAGPAHDQRSEEGICHTLVLQISELTAERAAQSVPPAVPFEISGLGPSQARVRVVAAAQDDLRAVTAVISTRHSLVGEPARAKAAVRY
ncbi:hypothetical protein ACFVYR_12440 [Streptomyces sp. NPDC058284]|uniref:hypothetical protein n=1 Tax=unclassified Streptomyces TaxID=2593676 RepID=UPI003664C290